MPEPVSLGQAMASLPFADDERIRCALLEITADRLNDGQAVDADWVAAQLRDLRDLIQAGAIKLVAAEDARGAARDLLRRHIVKE